jgi:hypothetical protein
MAFEHALHCFVTLFRSFQQHASVASLCCITFGPVVRGDVCHPGAQVGEKLAALAKAGNTPNDPGTALLFSDSEVRELFDTAERAA